jgi:hypothetical protein
MTTHFKNKVVRFIIEMHCFAHRTNLAIITLSNVLLVHQLEGILQNMFFFSHFKKVCRILKAYGSFQLQEQQDFIKCQNSLDFDVLFFKKIL